MVFFLKESKQEESLEQDKRYYSLLLELALLNLVPGSVMVCGPLGDPNSESFMSNVNLLREFQKKVAADFNILVFDQTQYLDAFFDNAPKNNSLKFEIFYKGLIEQGINALYVMPGWKNSNGTQQEIEYAKEAGKPIYYL